MPFTPATLLMIGMITGIGGVASYTAFHYAEKARSELTINDLRPCLPWEGLPLPRFVYTKPELLAEVGR